MESKKKRMGEAFREYLDNKKEFVVGKNPKDVL